MSYPGQYPEEPSAPQSWPRARSGYWPAGMSRQRDAVRGFPPTPGTPDPEYPSSAVVARNGLGHEDHGGHEYHGGRAPAQLNHAGSGTGVLAGGHTRPGGSGPGQPGRGQVPAADAWSTQWGVGPWLAGARGGAWAAEAMEGPRFRGLDTAVRDSRTWTYGEDEPTETWTLPAAAEALAEPASAAPHTAAPQATAALPGAAGTTTAFTPASAGRPGRSGRGPAVATPAGAAVTPSRRQGGGRRGRPRRRRSRMRVALTVVVALLAVTVLAAGAVYGVVRYRGTRAPAPTATHAAALPSPSRTLNLGKWQYISSRTYDPVPLTLAELYPVKVSAGPQTYARTAARVSANCPSAVFGATLKSAVRKGCTQALRASYLSVKGNKMGTIGVLNLATAAAAAKVGKVVAVPREFVQPLPAAHGPTRNLGKGTGVVWAVAKGHYLILMWAQYTNLHPPSTSRDRKVLMEFINDLYQETANQSLTRRMVTGSPLTP